MDADFQVIREPGFWIAIAVVGGVSAVIYAVFHLVFSNVSN